MRQRPVPNSIRNPFSAILLAGGRSTRMGRDKAALLIDGEPLWQRQLATLHATGADELFISVRAESPLAVIGARTIEDLTPEAGPLAALEAVLPCLAHTHAVVLAVDLPAMRADFLAMLMETALVKDCGVAPEMDGRFEPLAAVYTPAILPLVRECLRGPDRSMQNLLRMAKERGLVIAHPLRAEDRALFRNVNFPEDIA